MQSAFGREHLDRDPTVTLQSESQRAANVVLAKGVLE